MRPREDDVVFVVDECAGPHVRDGILDAGCRAILLTEKVPAGTEDVAWIPRAHEWGHAIITRDIAMRGNLLERAALANCGIHVFILRGGGLKLDELRAITRRHALAMRRYVVRNGTPFLAHVTTKLIDVKTPIVRRGGLKNA